MNHQAPSFRPVLAKTYDSKKHKAAGWWASEKFDGVRCIYMDGSFFTRTGIKIKVPPFFSKHFPPAAHLDGELYGGVRQFDRTSGVVRHHHASASEWQNLTFQVFDLVSPQWKNQPYKIRYSQLTTLLNGHLSKYLKRVEQIPCASDTHLQRLLKTVEERGGEGLVLRDPEAVYEHKRSGSLLKVKSHRSIDAEVVGHEISKAGKYKGILGALICRIDENGPQWKCGTGFTDAQRANPPALGLRITVKFFEWTKNGKPRFPVFAGIRAEQNL